MSLTTPSPRPTPSATPAPKVTPGSYANPAGAYSQQSLQGAFYNNWTPGTTVFTDPTTGATVAGAGMVPTKNGPKSVADLVLQARNPKNLANIRNLLLNGGLISKGTKSLSSIQNAWLQVVIGAQSSQIDPEDYIQQLKSGGFGQDVGVVDRTPSRSIYQYSPEQLGAKIDETAQNLLGRAITDADKSAGWYQDLNNALNKMVMQGTVTTTKQVKNPKTGKMENVTIQKPEVTTESIAQTITGALEQADPAALERKKNLDFANWAFKKMGGGI